LSASSLLSAVLCYPPCATTTRFRAAAPPVKAIKSPCPRARVLECRDRREPPTPPPVHDVLCFTALLRPIAGAARCRASHGKAHVHASAQSHTLAPGHTINHPHQRAFMFRPVQHEGAATIAANEELHANQPLRCINHPTDEQNGSGHPPPCSLKAPSSLKLRKLAAFQLFPNSGEQYHRRPPVKICHHR
jgi:hypothetical protein